MYGRSLIEGESRRNPRDRLKPKHKALWGTAAHELPASAPEHAASLHLGYAVIYGIYDIYGGTVTYADSATYARAGRNRHRTKLLQNHDCVGRRLRSRRQP